MIKEEEVYKIGYISKTHGLRGEVDFRFTDDIFDTTDSDYLLVVLDGIIVPFFIESIRFRSDMAAIVKFEDIDTSEKAQMLVGCDVVFERKIATESESQELTLSYFIGFHVVDDKGEDLGEITDVDDQTENWLFKVETAEGNELYIPAHEEFITDIDHESKHVTMDLPEGLLDI